MKGAGKAIFIDRDGTLIRNEGYACYFSEDLVFDYSLPALKTINSRQYKSVIVTNQSAIAKGICTLEEVERFHQEMVDYFKQRGAIIDKIYYCPYHEKGIVEPYIKSSVLRKPQPGMILQAVKDLNLKLADSYMVGDSTSDIMAGINAGCKTALVLTGYGETARTELTEKNIHPDIVADNLGKVIKVISEYQDEN